MGFDMKRQINEKSLIKELIPPLLDHQSNVIIREGANYILNHSLISSFNYTYNFFFKFLQSYLIRLNQYKEFYYFAKKWKTVTSEKDYFESNLFISLFQTVEGYINFKIIKLGKLENLTEFQTEVGILYREVHFFTNMISIYLDNKQLNILNYFFDIY